MATLAPTTCCMICGGRHEYRAVVPHRMPGAPVVFGPTEYEMLPHTCPPGAVEAFRADVFRPKGKDTMSWSIDLIGKPIAVAKVLAERAKQNPCREPEETIRQQVLGALGIALIAFPENQAVKVSAAGSQSGPDAEGKSTHNLSIKLEHLYGFLE